MTTKIIRVPSKRLAFVVNCEQAVVTQAPPGAKWAAGLTEPEFKKRCRLKGWPIEEIPTSR